jgi:hypothetical protein
VGAAAKIFFDKMNCAHICELGRSADTESMKGAATEISKIQPPGN